MNLLTLMYHSISRDPTDNSFTIEESRFEEQLRWLKLTGHRAVTISQVADWLDGRGSLPPRAFLITFDDGYLDNLEVALPLLQRFQSPACIFVTTAWCGDKQRRYSRQGERQCPMLTWTELRELADVGIEIGAHSVSHPFLTELPPEAAWEEIYRAKLEIEDHLGQEVQSFSYPNSRHNQVIRFMVQSAGYRLAFSGYPGGDRHNKDRYNLYRLCVYQRRSKPEFIFSMYTGVDMRNRYWNWRKQCVEAFKPLAR